MLAIVGIAASHHISRSDGSVTAVIILLADLGLTWD
jgi:hypothetical protein